MGFIDWNFALRLVNIVFIDLALSTDNAIVIGMTAASLPKERRKTAVLLGGLAAITVRIAATSIATVLLAIPFLSVVGGIVLVWTVYRLLRMNDDRSDNTRHAANTAQAVILIVASDFVMSTDNILAVAGAAHGNIILAAAGLVFSMSLIIVSGGFMSLLIGRFRWLVYPGAFAISFTAVTMVFEDGVVNAILKLPFMAEMGIAALIGIIIPALFIFFKRNKAQPIKSSEDETNQE